MKTVDGGHTFLLDFLFRVDYGPRDLAFIDGNLALGVTNVKERPPQHRNVDRFSMILFCIWNRERMKGVGNYYTGIKID